MNMAICFVTFVETKTNAQQISKIFKNNIAKFLYADCDSWVHVSKSIKWLSVLIDKAIYYSISTRYVIKMFARDEVWKPLPVYPIKSSGDQYR